MSRLTADAATWLTGWRTQGGTDVTVFRGEDVPGSWTVGTQGRNQTTRPRYEIKRAGARL